MISTQLFLTQTFLNLENIQKLLAYSFFVDNQLQIPKDIYQEKLDQNWQHYQNLRRIVDWAGESTETESQKETFRKFVSTEVYVQYSKPSLLFLGDLTTYSDTLQEGMLKLLEEPPQNLTIVIFAQSLSLLKGTIISRSQIHNLDSKTIFANLDLKLLAKTKKLPEPKTVVQNLLKNQKTQIDKISDFERSEIDFWLWQIQTNLTILYTQDPKTQIAEHINKLLQARKLNSDNLQKKFAIGWLNC